MSTDDKMFAFGRYLTEQVAQHRSMLDSLCANVNQPIDAIRLKYGHVEALSNVLRTFTELFNGDLQKFKKNHLNLSPEEQKELEENE